jgi:hypothetical protein
MTTCEHAIRITAPMTARQAAIIDRMRADQFSLLSERRERVPAPIWFEEPRADGRYMVFRFGSHDTAAVFGMTWGDDCGQVPPEQLDAWDESQAVREQETERAHATG